MRKQKPGGANYDFLSQNQPVTRMGETDYANMPKAPIYKEFSKEYGYRDGIINSFPEPLKDDFGIHENQR